MHLCSDYAGRPGIFNMRDRAKWDAWKAVEGIEAKTSTVVIGSFYFRDHIIVVMFKQNIDLLIDPINYTDLSFNILYGFYRISFNLCR